MFSFIMFYVINNVHVPVRPEYLLVHVKPDYFQLLNDKFSEMLSNVSDSTMHNAWSLCLQNHPEK